MWAYTIVPMGKRWGVGFWFDCSPWGSELEFLRENMIEVARISFLTIDDYRQDR